MSSGERHELMSEGQCFRYYERGHRACDCPQADIVEPEDGETNPDEAILFTRAVAQCCGLSHLILEYQNLVSWKLSGAQRKLYPTPTFTVNHITFHVNETLPFDSDRRPISYPNLSGISRRDDVHLKRWCEKLKTVEIILTLDREHQDIDLGGRMCMKGEGDNKQKGVEKVDRDTLRSR